MTIDEALSLLDAVLQTELLNNVQELVFRQVWEGRTYEEIAQDHSYDTDYIKHVGSQLWRLLSKAFDRKVTKSNVRSVLRSYQQQKNIKHPIELSRSNLFPQNLELPTYTVPPATLRQDWGEAVDGAAFFGRTNELTQLEGWVVADRCRLVALLGMGGIGKTSLSIQLAHRLQNQFEYLIWRSLRNAPPIQDLLAELIQFLSNQQELEVNLPAAVEGRVARLVEYLRQHRCLVLLDNAESILQGGGRVGLYRSGYEGYGALLRQVGESTHQSCLVLTSREKPREIAALEGDKLPVRSLQLPGLEPPAGQAIFDVKGLHGTEEEQNHLIQRYAGNPLALKLVSTSIQELFAGDVTEFLAQGSIVFGDIGEVLSQQFDRLSALEQEVMYWLAINREPITLAELKEDIVASISQPQLMEALESLVRRSLIERGTEGFTQQPVVMEYVTDRLIEHICEGIQTDNIRLFKRYALMKAQAKDYIRETQVRLILQPIIDRLLALLGNKEALKSRFVQFLSMLRTQLSLQPQYAAGNVLNLLCHLKVDLKSFDFSDLTILQAYCRNVNLHQVNFARSTLDKCVFTETFAGIVSVAFSPDGQLLATSDNVGSIRLWRVEDGKLLSICEDHPCWVWAVTFSPDGRILASGSEDETVKLWDVSTGQCYKTLQGHTSSVFSVAFTRDGQILASGSNDRTVKLWDINTGKCLKTLQAHASRIWSVAISPDGRTLASSSADGTVKLWDINTGKCLKTLQGHTSWVTSVSLSSDRQTIASGGFDRIVKLWDINTGKCLKTLQGHTGPIFSTSFSPNGKVLASAGYDRVVRLWSVRTGECLRTLQGHTNRIWSVTFNPDGKTLVSGGDDHAAKVWDVRTGQCFRTVQGHMNAITSVDFHPKGKLLASGNEDQTVKLWDISSGQCRKTFAGHTDRVLPVAFSPDGQTLLSGSNDRTIKLWSVNTGQCLKTLHGHTGLLWSVTFSPDGQTLASGSEDTTVRLWDARTGQCLKVLQHSNTVYSVAFSPNSQTLVSGGRDLTLNLWDVCTGQRWHVLQGHTSDILAVAFSFDGETLVSSSMDRTIKVWDISTDQCLRTLQGHTGRVWSMVLSPDGQILASSSDDRTLKLWDVNSGQCLKTLQIHASSFNSLSFSPNGHTLLNGSVDGAMKLWDVATGECLRTLRADRPYEGMNITGITGVTEATIASLIALGAVDENLTDF